jgi:hypothetical protein
MKLPHFGEGHFIMHSNCVRKQRSSKPGVIGKGRSLVMNCGGGNLNKVNMGISD